MAFVLAVAGCSGDAGKQLGSSLEDSAAAAASVDLSLGQVLTGRATAAASLTLTENMRREVVKARDSASELDASDPTQRRQRADALTTMDALLSAVQAARDAVSDGDRGAMTGARMQLERIVRNARSEASSLKGSPVQ